MKLTQKNFYLATMTGKDAETGKYVAILGIKAWASSKNDVWKELILNGLTDDDVIGSLKDALTTARASSLTDDDIKAFVLAVEENEDVDIFVWDLKANMEVPDLSDECDETKCEETKCEESC